ncbi:unnamed protein product [Dovyalis caffra]|uniref:Probable ubiquitin-like-specific protease 2A/B PH domain-containing protein n=1 Tax=Dovyalis caffra TaxID=77055 RepID=A0AAV1SRX6_9ROSI|nr:unnamed protein product [Dovyalis caffra]
MTRSGQKFSVFEFDEEEEKVEKESARFVDKFRIRKRKRNGNNKDDDTSPLTNDDDRQVGGCTGAVKVESSTEPIDIDDGPIDVDTGVAGETNTLCEGNSNDVVDIDVTVIDDPCQYSVSAPARMPQEDCDVKEDISRLDTLRLSSFSNYENESVGTISDNDVGIEMSSSTSVSSLTENEAPLGKQVPECVSVGHKIDYTNNTVAVFPDIILCGAIYGAESSLTFSGSSIRMEGSTANGVKGIFCAEWTLGDIISIESKWCETVMTAMVCLCLKSKVSEGAGNTNDTSDVNKLKFSVYDPLWHEGEDAIKSLHVRYRDNWNVTSDWLAGTIVPDTGILSYLDIGRSLSEQSFSLEHFQCLHETFEEVIYPIGDPDAVSICKRDVELLHPDTFINDTIIDFYIQMKAKIQLRYHASCTWILSEEVIGASRILFKDGLSTQSCDPNKEETGVEFLEEISRAVSGPDTDMGIQISLTAKSPMRIAQQRRLGELGLNSRDLFEPRASARSFSNKDRWQTRTLHWSSCMSPVQEAEETGEQISDSSSNTEDDWQPANLATEFSSNSFSHKDLRSLGSSRNRKYMQLEEAYDGSSSGASISGSLKSSEIGVGVDQDHLLSQFEGFAHQKQTDCHELSSKSIKSEEFADCVVDSQEGNCMHNDHVATDSPSSFHCNNLAASVDAINAAENILRKVRKPVSNVDWASDEQNAERTKLTSSDGT